MEHIESKIGGCQGWGTWGDVVRGYKLAVIRRISSGDPMCSMATVLMIPYYILKSCQDSRSSMLSPQQRNGKYVMGMEVLANATVLIVSQYKSIKSAYCPFYTGNLHNVICQFHLNNSGKNLSAICLLLKIGDLTQRNESLW